MTRNKSYLIKCLYESLLDSCKHRRWKDEQLAYLLNAVPAWVRSGNWPSFGYRVSVKIKHDLTVNDPKGTIILIAMFQTGIVFFDKLK